ncbi:MAG: TetR/AcrR family transcriptional regulator [Clostridiaceae bacterium]
MKQSIQEQIEETSLQYFSEQGFNETSTSEIALKAGVSEASIFRIYKTKHDLYMHVLTKYGNQANLNTNLIFTKITFEDLEYDLEIIVEYFIKFYFDNIHITRIYISNAIQFNEIMGFNFLIYPQLRDFLEKYFEEMSSRGLVDGSSGPELTKLITASVLQDIIILTTFEKLEVLNEATEEKLREKWKKIIKELGMLFGWHSVERI